MITQLLLVAFLAQSSPDTDPKCTLEGQVISASTGAPLKHASLRLSPVGALNSGTQRTAFTSITDNEGKFAIQNVDAGTYTLDAERVGYITGSYGARSASGAGTRLKLDGGQSMKNLVIKLVPQGMIFGKVIDDDGEPVPGAIIRAERYAFVNGKRELRQTGYGNSQADGSFVMGNLAAGTVYLSAEMRSPPRFNQIERAAGKTVRDELLKTYFPNARDIAGASPVEITTGAELRGIEIHMHRGRMFEIRGQVQNTVSNAVPDSLNLALFAKDRPSAGWLDQAYLSGKNTEFQFKRVLPGVYVVQVFNASVQTVDASGERGAATQLTGRVEVTVGDADAENIVIPLGTGLDITGRLRTEGDPPPSGSAPPNYSIYLQPTEARGLSGASARASAEGNFKIHNVPPSIFRVIVSGTPDGSYVKAIRFGGEDITEKNLDLSSGGGGELEVIISPDAADISGVVRNENGEALSGVPVQAFFGDKLKRSMNTDQNGSFHLTSLAPGDYRVYAFEDVEPGLSLEPTFRKSLENRAAEVKLEEKSHESLDLKVISKDEIEAAAAKIQ